MANMGSLLVCSQFSPPSFLLLCFKCSTTPSFFGHICFLLCIPQKSGADQLCTAPTCLKLFLSARWPAVFLRQAYIMLRLCHAAEIFIPCNRTAVLYRIRLFPAMEGERSDGTSYLNNLPKPIRHTSLLYIGCFLSRSHAYPYHASLCDTLRPQQKVALYSSFPPG